MNATNKMRKPGHRRLLEDVCRKFTPGKLREIEQSNAQLEEITAQSGAPELSTKERMDIGGSHRRGLMLDNTEDEGSDEGLIFDESEKESHVSRSDQTTQPSERRQ